MDHKADYRAVTLADFYQRLMKSGRHFSIALTLPKSDPKSYRLFCRMVWQVLDGRYTTVMIAEEIAGAQTSPGKATEEWGTLVREGRKFGLVILGTSQRAQEIDKTIFTQVNDKYIGTHDIRDARYIAKLVGLQQWEVSTLGIGEFYRKRLGPSEPIRIDIKLGKLRNTEKIVKSNL